MGPKKAVIRKSNPRKVARTKEKGGMPIKDGGESNFSVPPVPFVDEPKSTFAPAGEPPQSHSPSSILPEDIIESNAASWLQFDWMQVNSVQPNRNYSVGVLGFKKSEDEYASRKDKIKVLKLFHSAGKSEEVPMETPRNPFFEVDPKDPSSPSHENFSLIGCATYLEGPTGLEQHVTRFISQNWLSTSLQGARGMESTPCGLAGKDEPSKGSAEQKLFGIPHLSNFHNDPFLFSMEKTIHAFFPTNIRWNLVEELFQGRWKSFSTKEMSADRIPWVILQEVFRCHVFGVPLLCSSYPQRKGGDSDLYSLMHPMLRTMIIGHVLGYLDILLKGYINGGTFPEDCIFNYERVGTITPDALIDLQGELLEVRREWEKKGLPTRDLPPKCSCLRDFVEEQVGDDEMNFSDFTLLYNCGFRLLGSVTKVEMGDRNIMEVHGSVITETQLDIKPELDGVLAEDLKCARPEPRQHTAFVTAVKLMEGEIHFNMQRHPRFSAYFELLKIIAFCCALTDSFIRAGVFPRSVTDDVPSVDPVVSGLLPFPNILPPLPIRRGPRIFVEVFFADMIQSVYEEKVAGIINKMIRNEHRDLSVEERTTCLLRVARRATENAVVASFPEIDTTTLRRLDDGSLHAQQLATSFRQHLEPVLCGLLAAPVVERLQALCYFFPDTEPIMPIEQVSFTVKNYNEFLDVMSFARNTFAVQFERQALEEVEARWDDERDRALKTSNYIDQGYGASLESALATIEQRRAECIDEVFEALENLRYDVELSEGQMSSDPLGAYQAFSEGQETEPLSLIRTKIKLGYTDFPQMEDAALGVNGGCGIKEGEVTMQRSSGATQRHLKWCSEVVTMTERVGEVAGRRYFQLDIPFRYFAGDWRTLQMMYGKRGCFEDSLTFQRCCEAVGKPSPLTEHFALDSFGSNTGHFVISTPFTKDVAFLHHLLDQSVFEEPGVDGLLPFHVACMSGNVEAVRYLLAANVNADVILPSGLYPLLIACQSNFADIAALLLDKQVCADVNRTTATKVTSLHWAVLYRNHTLCQKLVSHGAYLIEREVEKATPLHLAAQLGCIECVKVLVEAYPDGLFACTSDQRLPLHYACLGNHEGTAAFLIDSLPQADRKRCLLHNDTQGMSPLTLSISLGHVHLCLLLCESAGIHQIEDACWTEEEENRLRKLVAEVPVLASFFNAEMASWSSGETHVAFQDVTVAEFTKEKVIERCRTQELKEELLDECIRLRDAECLKRVALFGSLSEDNIKYLLVAVARYGLHTWPAVLTSCGVDVCIENIDGSGSNLLYLSAKLEEDEKLLRSVWKEYMRFTPPSSHYGQLVTVLLASALKRYSTRRTIYTLCNEINGSPTIGEADVLLQTPSTSVSKWSFARSLGLLPSSKGVISGAGKCRPTVLQLVLSESVGLQEEVRLKMLQEALKAKRMDNAYTILSNAWPSFRVKARDAANSSLALSTQALIDRSNFPLFQKDLEEQDMVLKNFMMIKETNASNGEEFFQKLILRQFLPLKTRKFGVYAWLLTNGTQKFHFPWDAEIEDENGASGFMCSCQVLCEVPSQVQEVAASIGVSVDDLLLHPSFTPAIQQYSGSALGVLEQILRACPTPGVVAATLSTVAQLRDRTVITWNRLLHKSPAVLQELDNVLDTVVSQDGATVLMRLMPLPEATEMIDYIFQSPSIVNGLAIRDRYGRSTAHHLVALTGTPTPSNHALMRDAVNSIVTERLQGILFLCPPLIHQQERQGYTIFSLAAKMNNTPTLALLSTLAPVSVLDKFPTEYGYHALHVAAEFGSVKAIRFLVIELGLSPNKFTSKMGSTATNLTPLHVAASRDNPESFDTLIRLGADPLMRNCQQETPLHWAVRYGGEKIFKIIRDIPGFWWLLSRGELCASLAVNPCVNPLVTSVFFKAMHPNRCLRSTNDRTAFLEAVAVGTTAAIHELVSAGADLLAFDARGWNALHFASAKSNTSVLVHLLRYASSIYPASDVQNLLQQVTSDKDTPVHIAAHSGALGCAEVLLSFECIRNHSLRKQNNDGLTPANAAALAGHSELALILREASGNGDSGDSSALQAKHRSTLKSFWDAVPSQEREKATKRVKGIKVMSLNSISWKKNVLRDTEEEWEKAWNKISQTVYSLLDESEKNTLQSHSAFSSQLVKLFLLPTAGTSASVISRLLAWVKSSSVPSHTACFCVEQVLIWEPVDQWDRIMQIFSSFSKLWNKDRLEYPGKNHVLWEWLRLFFTPKKINCFYSAEFFVLLERFLSFLEGPVVKYLPTPEISIGDAELNFSVSACKKLRSVNEALGETQTRQDLQLAVSHLNYLWRRSCRWTLSMMTEGPHWILLENKVFHRFGVRCFSSIQSMEKGERLLSGEARAFVLDLMKNAPEDSSESDLMSWTATATLTIAVAGLDLMERVCFSLLERLQVEQMTQEALARYLPFLTSCLQSMLEIESEDKIFSALEHEWVSGLEYMDEVTRSLEEELEKVRLARLGTDRPIDELIQAFAGKLNPHPAKFEPHSYSFDGTPIVTLPPEELALLRDAILVAESVNTTMESSNSIKEKAQRAAQAMIQKPSVECLGQLVAYTREGIYRTMKKRPFRIQCMCLISFLLPLCIPKSSRQFKGRLAQVATGEGKSIIVAMVAAVFALMEKTVDVITSSRPLAVRDASEFSPFYQFYGLRCSHIAVDNPSMLHFNAPIVYGTNTDFEFAELREGCFMRCIRQFDPHRTNSWINRPKQVCVVDEADNLFLDAARNSARIAYSTGVSFTWVYAPIFKLVRMSKQSPSIEAVREALIEFQNGYYAKATQLLSDAQLQGWVEAAYAALSRRRDTDYIVRQQKVLIIDLDTGRIQHSSRWSRGIHEMVEIKEGVPVKVESGVIGSIAHPSFFDGYESVLGITGTAGEPEEREEIMKMYGVDTFDVPPHRPCLRYRHPTLIFHSKKEKQLAVVQSAMEKRLLTSVLILVPTIKESNEIKTLVDKFSKADDCCLVLNETQRENEDFILLKASYPGTILVATNTAGRGTDIRLSKEVIENGGLHVIYGGFPPNLRVECQGLGRSARQGQPGSNQIFISLDEELVQELVGADFQYDPSCADACVKHLYAARTWRITEESKGRARSTAVERVQFACLKLFFEDQRSYNLHVFTLENKKCVKVINELLSSNDALHQISMEELLQRLRECFRVLWVIFYTQLTDHRDPTLTISPTPSNGIEKQASDLYQVFLERSHWPTIHHLSKNISETIRSIFQFHSRVLFRAEESSEKLQESEKESEKENHDKPSTSALISSTPEPTA